MPVLIAGVSLVTFPLILIDATGDRSPRPRYSSGTFSPVTESHTIICVASAALPNGLAAVVSATTSLTSASV